MKVEWTTTHTAEFDLDQAQEDFNAILNMGFETDPDKAIYDSVEANLSYEPGDGDLPYGIIEHCATALRDRIGGIQLEMEGVR